MGSIMYLSKEEEGSYYFPTRKSLLQAQAEDAATPLYVLDSKGNLQYREDGSYVTRTKLYIYVEGKPIPADCIPREQVDALLNAIQEIDFTPESTQEREIVEIVAEEAAYFFNGVKSLDEVIEIIQSRVNLVIQANR